MNDNQIIEKMSSFGLTRQEATIYSCLLRTGEMTGYEAAKQTGISRSNAYNALAGLTEKGAAYLMEGTTSKYIPVPVKEFCENRIRGMEKDKEYLCEHVKTNEINADGYITIQGLKHIHDKIHNCLQNTEYRVYFYASKDFILSWREEIERLVEKNMKVVLLSDEELDIQGCTIYRTLDPIQNQLRLIIDSKYILTGSIQDSPDVSCLFSGQENFVQVFKEALRNEIRLVEMLEKDTIQNRGTIVRELDG